MTCDACGYEWIGATKVDAANEGWGIRVLRGGREFLMCAECEGRYELLWALREQSPSAGGRLR